MGTMAIWGYWSVDLCNIGQSPISLQEQSDPLSLLPCFPHFPGYISGLSPIVYPPANPPNRSTSKGRRGTLKVCTIGFCKGCQGSLVYVPVLVFKEGKRGIAGKHAKGKVAREGGVEKTERECEVQKTCFFHTTLRYATRNALCSSSGHSKQNERRPTFFSLLIVSKVFAFFFSFLTSSIA